MTQSVLSVGAPQPQAPRPMCWVCRRPVARLVWVEDPSRFVRHFVAECHGAAETVDLTHRDLVDATRIGAGWAFRPADALPGAVPAIEGSAG